MARRVVVQVRTELDDADRELIMQDIGPHILVACASARDAVEGRQWNDLGIGLADAGDWGMILSDIMRKDITTLEEIRARVGRLDTSARTPWWDVLDRIELQSTDA
jgi:hypothetical protein